MQIKAFARMYVNILLRLVLLIDTILLTVNAQRWCQLVDKCPCKFCTVAINIKQCLRAVPIIAL